jgi:hypothetical protein
VTPDRCKEGSKPRILTVTQEGSGKLYIMTSGGM